MSSDKWIGGYYGVGSLWSSASNWSDGVPTSASKVVIAAGEPQVNSTIRAASVTILSGGLRFVQHGQGDIAGAVTNEGEFLLQPDLIVGSVDGASQAANVRGLGGAPTSVNLTIGGVFTNSGAKGIQGGSQALFYAGDAPSATVSVKGFVNAGTLYLAGGAENEMLLDVTGGVAGFGTRGVISGAINLNGAAIEFARGEIASIAAKASLVMTDAQAVIEDADKLGANSALSGLKSVAGTLELDTGARVTVGGSLTNDGEVSLRDPSSIAGGRLTIHGQLTNNGTIEVFGRSVGKSTLAILGGFANDGVVDLSGDFENVASAVSGTGRFQIRNRSALEFGANVASGETVDFGPTGINRLILDSAATFGATITDFGTDPQDGIDAKTFGTGTIANFVENAAGTAGLLTLSEGDNVAHIALDGAYDPDSFSLVPDSKSGSWIRYG